MRHALAVGWLAGITAILAGWPAVAALTLPVLAAAGGRAAQRWGPGARAAVIAAVKARRAAKAVKTTGGTLERA